MIPARFVLIDEETGHVVNVVTIEDRSQFPARLGVVWQEDRTAQIGDVVVIRGTQWTQPRASGRLMKQDV